MKALLAYIIIAACIFTIQSHAAIEAVKVKPKAPQFSSALVEGVKHFENQPLASGKVKLNQGNHKGTPAIMMLYSSAGGKKLRGLTRRRTYETKDLWNG